MTSYADIILTNGKVLTMAASAPRAEAIAISGSRITAVGTHDQVTALRGNETRVIDARGSTVMPGFVESHMHLFPGAATLGQLSLEHVSGLDAFVRTARAYEATRPGEFMLIARQANYTMIGEHEPITRHHLDKAISHRPFAIVAPDAHTMWANTMALEQAGLLHGRDVGIGSEVVMGSDGLATGELREWGAIEPVFALSPTAGRDNLGLTTGRDPAPLPSSAERAQDIAVLQKGLDYCASLGITSIHNMDGNLYQLELLNEIHQAGGLRCRVEIPFHLRPERSLDALEEASEMQRRFNTDRLHSGRVKIFMDGVLDSWTAFVLDGYPDRPDTTGAPLFSAEQFNAVVAECDRRGLQIAVHAIGDAAVRRTLDGYEAGRRTVGPRDSRHRIEHIEIIDPADIPRFRELGVIASMQPLHAAGSHYFPLEPTLTRVGDKLPFAYPWQTLRDAGARLIFSSDWPVSPLDPLKSVKAAMTRERLRPDLPDQRQSLMDSLASYTSEGAYAEFMEDRKGRLEPGMLADVIVLTGDIETTPADEIDGLAVATTICDGRITFER
ncbi:amidohydrolase [Rhodoligotrophos defluvii]|uniref:amidohydrolase n=1 Tax=Rhodoligotrophos defluvii TaxID=2561934 RepID=UPI0010C9B9B6|nr:amidohydrolase [Rhodoligotrophos defluvii]